MSSFIHSKTFPFLLRLLRFPPSSVLSLPGGVPLDLGRQRVGESVVLWASAGELGRFDQDRLPGNGEQ